MVAPASAQYLTADEIKRLFAGTTADTYIWDVEITSSGTFGIDRQLRMTLQPDGSMKGDIESDEILPDVGKWWTEKNDLFCFQWESLDDGDKQCARLALQKDGKTIELSRPDGKKFEFDWTIIDPGPQAVAVIVATTGSLVFGAPSPARPPASPSTSAPPAQQPLTAARDDTPPVIDVPGALAAKSAAVEIAGRVSDSSRIIEVTMDGRPVAVAADGSFSARRGVPMGESTITVVAVDEWGNRAMRKVTVTREAVITQRRIKVPGRPSVAAKPRPDPFAGIHFGAYHALVIGNNNYRELPKLKTAANDAKSVAKLLTDDYGFETKLLLDATRADIFTELGRLRAKLTPNDNLLIYYAGHGILDEIGQQGYWLPVDAQADIKANWVSNGDITTSLRAIRAKHVLVVADSCYSGTLVRAAPINIKTSVARKRWIDRMTRKRARTALVSGGLEPVADSGREGHSVFANAFMAALRANPDVMDGQALYDAIKRPVVLNADQTPQYSDIRRAGHDGGDFIFVRKR
ncbi:MAG: caspase family protein [Proteobacteria bacterium]|nr:caspase family protein [Pseudomonadota bacterium]